MAWTIRYFIDDDGSLPAEEFEGCVANERLLVKLLAFIEQVALNEGRIGGGIFEKCHGGYSDLYEVRAKRGKELARSLCTRDGNNLILLWGVSKLIDQPTPTADLDRAQALLDRYRKTKRVDPSFEEKE